jgi:hypothetical protein
MITELLTVSFVIESSQTIGMHDVIYPETRKHPYVCMPDAITAFNETVGKNFS